MYTYAHPSTAVSRFTIITTISVATSIAAASLARRSEGVSTVVTRPDHPHPPCWLLGSRELGWRSCLSYNSLIATWPWSWSASPRRRPWPRARWVGPGRQERRRRRRRRRRCAPCSARCTMDGIVVIGEGEKDDAPMLFNGERVGDGTPPQTDIAVDPIDGTTLTAQGRTNAISVIAVSERGTMFDPGPSYYMEKIAVGPERGRRDRHHRHPDAEPALDRQGQAREPVRDLTVVILDRPRHAELIDEVRDSRRPHPPDQRRRRLRRHRHRVARVGRRRPDRHRRHAPRASSRPPRSSAWAARSRAACGRATTTSGRRQSTPATTSPRPRPPTISSAATTASSPPPASPTARSLRGVRYDHAGAHTQSLVMRSQSGTVRLIEAHHRIDKLKTFASVDYE